MSAEPGEKPSNFIQEIILEHNAGGRFGGQVITRFPPEPNGYLHIGHAEAITIDFGMAAEFGGRCHLRFDDTNPTKENQEYVDSIIDTVRWLGYDWGKHLYYPSDYFEQLYAWAVELIKAGKAYVDDLTQGQISEYRGTLTEPGRESPYRNRSVEENLDLFARMRAGEFDEGTKTLRAKIDMASGNINLRDPVMYRIRKATHHRTGDAWCIYPMYDWAHGQSDSIEGITHSICTLEYEDHRPLYDWYLDQLGVHHPQQIEFARLNLSHTVMSKRKLLELVEEGLVSGWDDPRTPTLAGLRRRVNKPEDPGAGTRKVPFGRILHIEQDDFRDPPPPKYFRLSPGVEVRLRYAYIVKCTGVTKDPKTGEATEVRCTYDPKSRGGDSRGRKVKGTIHWVSAPHALVADVRLYDTLFTVPKPDEAEDLKSVLNPRSLEALRDCRVEPALAGAPPGSRYQFERQGYFCVDSRGSRLVRGTPEIPGRHGAIGLPAFAERPQRLRRRPGAAAVGDAEALAHAEVVHRQYVEAAQGEDEQHLDGPAADTVDLRQALDHLVVAEPAAGAPCRHRTLGHVAGDVLDGADLGPREAGAANAG